MLSPNIVHVYNILKLASSVHLINHHRHAALALQPVDGRRVDGGIRPRVRELSTVDLQTGTCTTLLDAAHGVYTNSMQM